MIVVVPLSQSSLLCIDLCIALSTFASCQFDTIRCFIILYLKSESNLELETRMTP